MIGTGILQKIRDIQVFVKTFGCTYNIAESRKLIEVLKSQGCTLVDSPRNAGAVIVNTCTVIAPTERKVLKYLAGVKTSRLYVTGCMTRVQMPEILEICTTEIITAEEIDALYHQVETVPAGSVGIVQIAQGCRGRCTYCITRKAQGPLRSIPLNEILSQVRRYLSAGAVEIQLTAQDTGCWGADLHTDLPTLLNAVVKIPGTFRVRVGMMHPSGITRYLDRLVRAYQDNKIFSFIHLPLQSGSDKILSSMGRGYSRQDFFSEVNAFRAEIPEISIATDIIVGFPGETHDDFAASVSAIEHLRPQKVNITRYSRRPSCNSSSLYDYPDFVKKTRSRYLNQIADRIYQQENDRLIGQNIPIIVTEQLRNGSVVARTSSYLNVVIRADLPAGYQGRVILKEAHLHYFIGQLVDDPAR